MAKKKKYKCKICKDTGIEPHKCNCAWCNIKEGDFEIRCQCKLTNRAKHP